MPRRASPTARGPSASPLVVEHAGEITVEEVRDLQGLVHLQRREGVFGEADRPRRDPGHGRVGGDVLQDDAAGADLRALADDADTQILRIDAQRGVHIAN